MRLLACLIALLASSPALARTQHAGWSEVGHPSYGREDYARSGPAPLYLAPNSYVMYAPPGLRSYTYPSGVRVWYGSVPAFAPVLSSNAILAQGPALAAPASPGPRVYRQSNGVRVWYGQ